MERGVASLQRLRAERPQLESMLETVIGITHFQTGVSWYSHSLKDDVQKIESFMKN